ncbi:MAG: hypothetical protein ACRDPC_03695 [Solirubrobacteraceae bacterium]
MNPPAERWTRALADVLLPLDTNLGRPVRLDCDDGAVAEAGRRLGIGRDQAVTQLVKSLHAEGFASSRSGVAPLARAVDGDPPDYLLGLAVLVLAASRMAADQRASMHEYYGRLADLLDIQLASTWPQVRGVPELVERFDDLATWMAQDQAGRRGLLDLPADVHPTVVGVPIHQSLLRAGDRVTLGAFFERTDRLLDAGWDPMHQLGAWGGRHQLTAPVQQVLERPDLHQVFAGALRAARAAWDGSTVDRAGRRLLPAQLALHLPPLPFTLSVTVPALAASSDGHGPGGFILKLDPSVPDAVPLDWLTLAADGPVIADVGAERVRVLPGPTILFEITSLGTFSVAAAAEDPVWVLTCDNPLIAGCPPESRYRAPLPAGWALLCDVELDLLADELRVRRDDEQRPLAGVAAAGGLALAPEVWLLDHPPRISCDLPEPAPVTIDDRAYGDVEPHQVLDLAVIAHRPGVHHVDVGEQRLTVELTARGPRDGLGSLGFDADPRRVFAGAKPITDGTVPRVIGAIVEPRGDASELPLMVRYRCPVDLIDLDGTKRNLAPPPPAAWLEHVGLPADGPWEIPEPSRVAWLCVDAPGRRFVIARAPVDVPLTDDVLDVVDWYADASEIVDRSDGRAEERWQRLLAALEDDAG